MIVGCGRIAGGYDEAGSPERVLSHAGAYRRHPGFEMVACVERDAERRKAFMAHWNIPHGFADLASCFDARLGIEVASLCLPTEAHAAALARLLELPLRAVLCEKPLTDDVAENRRLVEAYEAAGRLLAVNYMRRWDPDLRALAHDLRSGRWGEVRAAVGYYSKGLLNNGSHMVDLVDLLIGPARLCTTLSSRVDWREDDPSIDVALACDGVPVYLIAGDSRDYTLFELEIVAERGVISIEDSGCVIRTRAATDSDRYPGQRHLGPERQSPTGLERGMMAVIDNLHSAITMGEPLACDGRQALAVEGLCAEIRAAQKE